jgi:hypothetical protein
MDAKLALTPREERRLKVFGNDILKLDIREMKWLETGRKERLHSVYNLLYKFTLHET